MSVIDDALRTAQREKELREQQAGTGRPFAPVLVRLRSQPKQGLRREFVLAGAAVVTVAFAGFLWTRVASDPTLPAIPPVTSAILSEALASDARTQGNVVQQAADSVTGSRDTTIAVPLQPQASADRRNRPAAPPVAAPGSAPVQAPADVAAAQGVERPTSVPAVERQSRGDGTLRIAMEPGRGGDASRLFSEAIAAHRARDYARARVLYEQVLVIAPSDGDALNNLAVLLSAERQFGRALELLRRASVAAPRNAGVWNNIGSVLREQGHGTEALAAFRQALAIDPHHQAARVGLAQQYWAAGSLDDAAETLRSVLADNPELAEAHYTLGQVREAKGDIAGAISSYAAFVRFAPDRLASHVELVRRRMDALSVPR